MIIVFKPRFSLDEILFCLRATLGILLAVALLAFSVKIVRVENLHVHVSERGEKVVAMDKILTGALALRENNRSPMALALEQKLVLLAQSLRPDVKKEERVFRIGVRGADAECVVKEGQSIFCHLTEHASGGIEGIEFVEGGEVEMVPHVLDGRSLLLKVQLEGGEGMEVVLKASEAKGESTFGGGLQGAKWWGPDLFFREYGGKGYRPLGQKQQVEVVEGKQRYVLYVGAKDFLSFQGGKWVVVEGLEGADRSAPLAQVQAIGQNEMEIEAWNGEGFPLFHAKLQKEKAPLLRFLPEQVVQGAKQRTARQVSCKMGKKHFVLQEGDWLVKMPSGWHKLKSSGEIDAFLGHEMRGELCVIDRIDAKGMVKGHYYSEMRTEVQPFSFRTASSKGSKKKKGGS